MHEIDAPELDTLSIPSECEKALSLDLMFCVQHLLPRVYDMCGRCLDPPLEVQQKIGRLMQKQVCPLNYSNPIITQRSWAQKLYVRKLFQALPPR